MARWPKLERTIKMRFMLGMFAAIPAVLLFTGGNGIHSSSQDASASWLVEWERARSEARRAKQPLFVVFR